MTSARPVEPPAASAEPSTFLAFFRETTAIAQVELRKLFRDNRPVGSVKSGGPSH